MTSRPLIFDNTKMEIKAKHIWQTRAILYTVFHGLRLKREFMDGTVAF